MTRGRHLKQWLLRLYQASQSTYNVYSGLPINIDKRASNKLTSRYSSLANSLYRTLHDFCTKEYFATVSISDEAFVWLAMEIYYERWLKNVTEKAGAKVGVNDTIGRKQKQYTVYAQSVTLSRKSDETLLLWSAKLAEIARVKRQAAIDNRTVINEAPVPVEENDDDTDKENDEEEDEFMQETRKALGGGVESEIDE